jgi:hypothetical protein
VAFRELGDEIVRASKLGCRDRPLHRSPRIGEGDVAAHRAVEQGVLLQNASSLPAAPGRIDDREIDGGVGSTCRSGYATVLVTVNGLSAWANLTVPLIAELIVLAMRLVPPQLSASKPRRRTATSSSHVRVLTAHDASLQPILPPFNRAT